MMKNIVVSGSFDTIDARQVRFLQAAAELGRLQVMLWSDEAVRQVSGQEPKFPQAERAYFLGSVRYVDQVILVEGDVSADQLSHVAKRNLQVWVVPEKEDSPAKQAFARSRGIEYQVIRQADLQGYAINPEVDASASEKRVLVTGCYDWFHSGHVRFFEETAALGDLYVVVGHDDNIRLLKGQGHPMFPQTERRYMAGSIRFVRQALVSSGHGWMDAEPEIEKIKPDIYAVNEDGDKPEKRQFCQQQGLEYIVLKRTPATGLPARTSTDLRGF
jgi:cytidyltransferase-like protein